MSSLSADHPTAARPWMPGYGVVPADEGRGLLSWAWAERRLADAHEYWLATVHPVGPDRPGPAPHVMPVWGVWLEGRLWLSTSPGSRKAANLAANPAVAVTTGDPKEPVVIEGASALVTAPADVERFAGAMDDKYETDYGVDFYAENLTVAISPATVFALDADDFTGTPTRWRFGPA
ncbi:MAG: pyridoxamine 5'-phosphate oxidase family protein [Acidimicrobiia bacterium]|nr:pyridoxamine 5'-phosphate oxidase family protein [Acidimicrobiia bacterium]